MFKIFNIMIINKHILNIKPKKLFGFFMIFIFVFIRNIKRIIIRNIFVDVIHYNVL